MLWSTPEGSCSDALQHSFEQAGAHWAGELQLLEARKLNEYKQAACPVIANTDAGWICFWSDADISSCASICFSRSVMQCVSNSARQSVSQKNPAIPILIPSNIQNCACMRLGSFASEQRKHYTRKHMLKNHLSFPRHLDCQRTKRKQGVLANAFLSLNRKAMMFEKSRNYLSMPCARMLP